MTREIDWDSEYAIPLTGMQVIRNSQVTRLEDREERDSVRYDLAVLFPIETRRLESPWWAALSKLRDEDGIYYEGNRTPWISNPIQDINWFNRMLEDAK